MCTNLLKNKKKWSCTKLIGGGGGGAGGGVLKSFSRTDPFTLIVEGTVTKIMFLKCTEAHRFRWNLRLKINGSFSKERFSGPLFPLSILYKELNMLHMQRVRSSIRVLDPAPLLYFVYNTIKFKLWGPFLVYDF